MKSNEVKEGMRSRWQTDVRRAWGRQFKGKGKILFFAVPFFVGLAVFAAFLGRKSPIDKNFIFFSTVYAFWIGLFNASGLVTGAVEQGEWSYWVLGMRRSFGGWLTANSVVCLILSLMQITVFMLAVSFASNLFDKNSLMNCFVETHNDIRPASDFLAHMTGCKKFDYVAIFLTWGLAMLSAGFSGVAYGVLVSCFAKDSLGATKAAVGLVVTAMVLSAPVLSKDDEKFPAFPPLWLKCNSVTPFWASAAVRAENVKGEKRDELQQKLKQARTEVSLAYKSDPDSDEFLRLEAVRDRLASDLDKMSEESNAGFWPHLLEDVSYILPQRYFYNIARMMDRDVMSAGDEQDKPIFMHTFRQLKPDIQIAGKPIYKQWKKWTRMTNNETLKIAKKEGPIHGGAYLRLLLKLISTEVVACLILSAAAFAIGYTKIKRTGEFYAIR